MKLVLIGIPGSGKSTQGNLLSRHFAIPYLSTGDIFRTLSQENTDDGRYVRDMISTGALIPDEKTITIVHMYLQKSEYQQGYILDGFPRTVSQAEAFGENIDRVIYLTLSDEVALSRLSGRKDHSRSDDTEEVMRRRLSVFHDKTKPVIDYYQKKGMLLTVDGTPSVEVIHKTIIDAITQT